jgi:hypothetical protein
MATPLTTDQFRILRMARDGISAPARVFRPKGYFLDVEQLVRENLVTCPNGIVQLTALGATRLGPTLAAEHVPGD